MAEEIFMAEKDHEPEEVYMFCVHGKWMGHISLATAEEMARSMGYHGRIVTFVRRKDFE